IDNCVIVDNVYNLHFCPAYNVLSLACFTRYHPVYFSHLSFVYSESAGLRFAGPTRVVTHRSRPRRQPRLHSRTTMKQRNSPAMTRRSFIAQAARAAAVAAAGGGVSVAKPVLGEVKPALYS